MKNEDSRSEVEVIYNHTDCQMLNEEPWITFKHLKKIIQLNL